MPIVKDKQKVDHFNKKMEAIGYEPEGECGANFLFKEKRS
ncbi:hypothetical protein RZN22_04955 [Bacillaceae bacterium S4-13-58]